MVIRSSSPIDLPIASAPFTPAAGPERTILAGTLSPIAALVTVPPDCMICQDRPKPSRRAPSSSRERYPRRTGRRAAEMTVVNVRSYSRNSGRTSLDRTIGTSSFAERIRPTSRSCSGLR